MRLTRLRGSCPDTQSCPTLYLTDRGTAVIQGDRVTDPTVRAHLLSHEAAVEVPLEILAGVPVLALSRTGRGTCIVWGDQVTDDEALEQLCLPSHETAVEVSLAPVADVAPTGSLR